MRLDYTLYVLAAILFLITVVSSLVVMETEKNLWVVTTAILGLFSVGLGYNARPKIKKATQPATSMPQTQKPITAAVQEQKASVEAPIPASVAAPATPMMALTEVKGVGEKRAEQLKALGINSVEELAKASANEVAKKLKISPKIVDKWIANAKELTK
jgi:predicted flap endonuclease-1-like 5' DNA nuclease